MATPSPEPAPLEQPTPPQPAPVPSIPIGPTCVACGGEAVVHWQRRPTDDELDALIETEQSRRAEALLLADEQQPAPVFPPLPTAADTTRTVYACANHAITLDGAARVHLGSCTAPNEADLPGCDCTPESPPAPEPRASASTKSRLPAHWVAGGQ